MEKVVVYGLGHRWMESREYIQTNYEIVGYSDSDISKGDAYPNEFIAKTDIGNYEFDFVLVTSYLNFEEIKNELCNILFIDKAKIKSIYQILCDEYCTRYEKERGTSITDARLWPSFCKVAANNQNVFDKFRSNPVTLFTCEHFEEKWDKPMIAALEEAENIKFSDKDWDIFLKNDDVGGAIKKEYIINKVTRKANCTTLRYVRVLQQILELFDNMSSIKSVVEIGGGYGGQCRILSAFCPIEKYTVIDLPEVLELIRKYIKQFNIENKDINYIDGTSDFSETTYDLVISNYAFSEMEMNVQEVYLSKIICRAKTGFIIWNNLSADRLGGYSLEEVLARIPGAKTISEFPQTGTKNCIIVWGMTRAL